MDASRESTQTFPHPTRRLRLPVNEGPADRLIRIVVGIVLLSVAGASWVDGPLFWVALAFGVLTLVTGLTGFCPTYIPFGISTVRKRRPDTGHAGGE